MWSEAKVLRLTHNMRIWKNVSVVDRNATEEARSFAKFRLDIRNGEVPFCEKIGPYMIELPSNICLEHDDAKELLYETYGLPEAWTVANTCYKAILCSKNVDVDLINSISLELFPGEERIHRSIDTVEDLETDQGLYPTDFLNSLTPS